MTAEIKIGDKPVMMCGNAATPIRYKQVFHQDLLRTVRAMTADDFDVDALMQLAYIMSQQAAGADFRAVTFDMFCDWLAQFEQADILDKVGEILTLWMQSADTTVKGKKK